MRELQEDELDLVRGGKLTLAGLSMELLTGTDRQSIAPDTILKHEFKALERLPVHTLMDQMNVNS